MFHLLTLKLHETLLEEPFSQILCLQFTVSDAQEAAERRQELNHTLCVSSCNIQSHDSVQLLLHHFLHSLA
jgi:hypothetical protein